MTEDRGWRIATGNPASHHPTYITGAEISKDPLALANALKKLHRGVERIPMEANPATAHMFIVNPLTGGGLMTLFSTHPPMDERIRRLEKMAGHKLS